MTDTERALLKLWSESLDVKEIGIDDDFFDLGGTSLKAFALLVQIEQRFAKSPGIGKGFEANTIRRQAEFLDDARNPPDKGEVRPLLLKGRVSNEKRPLFLVHGAAPDELDCYFHLVQSLPDEVKVYGLQSHGKMAGSEFETIEEMAKQHIRAIRSVQASGPYCLGGFCFGGLVAFEIAQQFLSMGETIESLIVFDYALNFPETFRFPRTTRQLVAFLANCRLAIRDLVESKRTLKACVSEASAWLYRTIIMRSGNGRNGAPHTGFWHCGPLSPLESERSLGQFRSLRKYKPRQYPGAVILFRHRRLPILQPYDSSMGWSTMCSGGVNIQIIDGSSLHGSILREETAPHVANELLRVFSPLSNSGAASERSFVDVSD